MVGQKILFPPRFFLDPVSEIRDPGWIKIRIREKHPGSATLKIFGILLDTEAEVCNGAGEVPLDEDVPGLEVAVRYCRLPLNRKRDCCRRSQRRFH